LQIDSNRGREQGAVKVERPLKLDREFFDRTQKPKINASNIMRKFFYGITALSCLAWCGTSVFAQAGGAGAGGAGASGSGGAGSSTSGAGSGSSGGVTSGLSNPASGAGLSQPNTGLNPNQGLATPNSALPPGQTGSTFQGSGQARSTLPSTASPGVNAGGRANIDINAPGVGVDVNRGSGANVEINRQGQPDISAHVGGGGGQPGASISVGNDRWRMVRYNNEWWYYTPQNSWMYYRDNNWSAYDAGTFRPLQRYRTAFRGLNQNMDERREMRDTVRDARNDNRDTRIDARQGNRDQIQDNRDKVRDERREMRNDIQDNRLTNPPALPGTTPQTPGSTPGAQIPSLPTPGTTNTYGSIGGAAGGN